MNAKKLIPHSSTTTSSVALISTPLKYLSASQREKTHSITKDWRLFTYELFGEILNKI